MYLLVGESLNKFLLESDSYRLETNLRSFSAIVVGFVDDIVPDCFVGFSVFRPRHLHLVSRPRLYVPHTASTKTQ